jgi:hypothetical protein
MPPYSETSGFIATAPPTAAGEPREWLLEPPAINQTAERVRDQSNTEFEYDPWAGTLEAVSRAVGPANGWGVDMPWFRRAISGYCGRSLH